MTPNRFPAVWAAGAFLWTLMMPPASLGQEGSLPDGVIDPGALQQDERRQQEREAQRRSLEAPRQEVIIDDLRREDDFRLPDEGPSFLLQGVRFSATELLDEAALREISARYVGREVSFGDLNRLMDEINALYDDMGAITARALIPPQEIEDGIVSVLLVEGRLGKLSVAEPRYTRPGFLEERLELPEPGEILDLVELQSALTRFNSIYELDLAAGLEPGDEFGESDLMIVPHEAPRRAFSSFADNAGMETTGRERLGATGTWRGLLGRDDNLFAYLAAGRSSFSGLASYGLPVNKRGGRVEASVSANDIAVSRGAFEELDIEGRSYVGRVNYRHPVVRRGGWIVDAIAHLSYTKSDTDHLDGLALSSHSLAKTGGGVRATHRGTRHQITVTQNVAHVRAEESRSDLRDNYVLWDGAVTWVRQYAAPVYTVLSANWRLTPERELPSPDLYQAGGFYSVRGYEQNVITGARGYAASFELHWPVTARATPYIFVDHGAVQAVSPRRENITGSGAGVSFELGRRFVAELDVARAATTIEPDQDRTQIHFRLTHSFEID